MNYREDNWLYLTRIDRQLLGKAHGVMIGAWCLSRDEICSEWDSYVFAVDPRQWGRKEACESNTFIANAFDKLLPIVGEALNRIHGTTYGVNFWRITCGYWFRQYLSVLYDRYKILCEAHNAESDKKVSLIPKNMEWVATDTDDYAVAVFSDRLNHQLFGQIIRARKLFAAEERNELASVGVKPIGRPSYPVFLKYIASWGSCILGKFNKVVFLRTYFPKALLTKLAFRFLSVPLLGTPRVGGRWVIDRKRRAELDAALKSKAQGKYLSNYERLSLELISENIPQVFIERFGALMKTAQLLRPKCAKLFLTSNAIASEEIYKVWVGLARELGGSQHVIMQHGGNYGHSEVYSDEEFEVGSCSKFLASGWAEDGAERHVNSFCLPILSGLGDFNNNQPVCNNSGEVIWVLASLMRYHYTGWSAPQGSQFIEYLREQVSFLSHFSKKVRKKIFCRPYHYDYGWNDLDYIKHHCGEFRIDQKRRPLRDEMASAQLMVFTYDSTSMMESMVLNVPTICFWNPVRFAWRTQARPLLKRLAEAGIYHEQAVEASGFIDLHISEGTISEWWSSPEVQEVRKEYCEQYANTSDNEYARWSNEIGSWIS